MASKENTNFNCLFIFSFQKKKPNLETPLDILNKERQKEKKVEQQLKNQIEEQRRKMLLQANEDEDKIIKKLEKQLGLNKTKNKNNFFADDGLDCILLTIMFHQEQLPLYNSTSNLIK